MVIFTNFQYQISSYNIMHYPKAIQKLIDLLSMLPSVGPKTAERYVFYLLNRHPEELQKLAQAIAELKENITICKQCLAVAEANPCSVCADAKRDRSILCVVANTRDMLTIESTGTFRGYYHVLGGLVNVIDNIGPDKLTVKQLLKKTAKGDIKEMILALNPNMEGETTALYLKKLFQNNKIKISRLAKGLPSGAELEYADELTLGNALKYRTQL